MEKLTQQCSFQKHLPLERCSYVEATVLLIFINGLFQGFSLELWFHEHLITHPKLTHEIEYNFRLFFLDFNNSTLPHTFSTMWAFLCGHHQVLEKLHIKKPSVFPTRPPFRTKGLPQTLQNRNFTSVFVRKGCDGLTKIAILLSF